MTTNAPVTIACDGLYAVIRGAHPYRAALQSVGAKWRADDSWRLPLTVANMNTLQRAGVPLGEYEEHISADPWLVEPRSWSGTHPMTYQKLYSYQREAADYLVENPFPGALLALSPGLGKTAVSIVAAEMLDAESVLVICPKVLIPVWRQERERWGTLPWNDAKQNILRPFVVTNWEFLMAHPDEFITPHWSVVILDESILVKQRKTKRFSLAKKLRKRTGRMWLLSGSPISRYVDDLWAQLSLAFPDAHTSYWRWVAEYCFVQDNVWGGKDITGSRPFATNEEWKDLMFVKHQGDVLSDLPPYITQDISVDICGEQKKLYDKALHDFIVDLDGEELPITTKIAQITRLQQIVSNPTNCDQAYKGNVVKLDALLELVASNAIALPILIWTYHRQTAIAIAKSLDEAGLRSTYVIGGMESEADKRIADFKEGRCEALVLSQGVGKYGLTLTNTRTAVYYDRGFDSDAWTQSLYRVRRIGLDHAVHLINLVCPGTTDAMIQANLEDKARSIAAVTNADLATILRSL